MKLINLWLDSPRGGDKNTQINKIRNEKNWLHGDETTCYLKNQWINEEIKKEIKKYVKTKNNENPTTQNQWDASKAVLRGKFIAIHAFLKKEEKSQVDNLTHHLNELEKEQKKPLKSAEGRKEQRGDQ